MPSGNSKPNSLVEWVAGHNMPKKKTRSLRPLLSASVDIMTDDINKKDYVAVGFPHNNSPLRLFDRGQSSSKKVTFNSSALRHSVDALSLLADSSGGEFLSDYDSDDNVAPSKALVKPRKSSFKQGKERTFVDTDTSEGETGHADHGMSPHPNCDCILCAAGRSLMRELGKGGPDHASVANAAKKSKASKTVESEGTAGETTTAGETESEPQSKGKGKKGKGGGGQGDSQNQEKKDDGGAKKDNNNNENSKKDEAKKNENDNKKNNNESKKNDGENKKDGDNNKKGDQGKGDQGKGDQGKQNNNQEAKGNPAAGNTPLPYRGSPNNRIILPVRQQTVHLEHAIEDTAKDHPPNAYVDLNRDVCRMYHGSEWGTHRKPHPSHSCAMMPPTPSQNMASMYPMGPYIHGMPSMPPMYPPQVHPQSAYTQMMYPHHMYQPAYIPAAQQQSSNQQTAQAFLHPQMYVPQLHPSYGVYPPHSQPGAAYAQPGAMWGAPAQAAPPAASFMPAAATANAGLSGMGLSGMDPSGMGLSGMGLSGMGLSGMGPSLSGLPNDPGEPPVVQFQPSRSPYTAAEASDLLAKQREETRKRYPNGITGSSKAKSPAGSVKVPSKTPTENGANGNANGNDGGTNGNDGGINGYHWNDKTSNGGDNANNTNNDAGNGNNSGEAHAAAEEWAASAPDATSWEAPAVASWDTGNDGWGNGAAAPTRYDASQSGNGDPDTVNDNPAGHMPGSWNAWETPQSGSQPGSINGAADSGYVSADPVPADQDVPTWNETTTSMLSSFGMCCRSTLSAAKQTIFGPSSDNTGVDNGEEQGGWDDPTVDPANGTAQGGWGDSVANEPASSW